MQAVSVVIPTHLRSHLLRESIASVAAQTLQPVELLVVDDANDPATQAVVAEADARLPFAVRYIANETGGVCHSRNKGAQAATGRWIGFLDDDDLWHPPFLERLVGLGEKKRVGLVLGGLLHHEDEHTVKPRAQLTGLTPDTALRQNGSMTGSNFVIDRDAYFRVGGFDPAVTVFNDWDFFVRLLDAGVNYAVDPEPLAEWRFHPGDRIATPSLRRAAGIGFFLDRHGKRMSPQVWRDLETTMLGIRRLHTKSRFEKLKLSVQLIRAHGPLRYAKRILRR
ncbi:glycosyltransferase family A protein [Sphingomonas sp. T9W2]|uniref:glycosyltransferase family 2 protein n=1 Tax=Sphingomonas sp. T9W2 TaxID=3143183 RepID=UPI0031F56416